MLPSNPLRGPFRSIRDVDLCFGPCAFCGKRENSEVISRAPCESCGQIVCWECADCGVFGSLHDFQSFVFRHTKGGDDVYLRAENCPACQEISWMDKYGGTSSERQASEDIEKAIDDVFAKQASEGGDVVKKGSALYDQTVSYRVWIVRSSVWYGTGDYEDTAEVREDREAECFYVYFESPVSCVEVGSRSGAYSTLSEAIAKVRELTNGTIRWQ